MMMTITMIILLLHYHTISTHSILVALEHNIILRVLRLKCGDDDDTVNTHGNRAGRHWNTI